MVADELIEGRLAELRCEAQLGEERLRELMQQERSLRETLLRISGAIQVIEEILATPAGPRPGDEPPDDAITPPRPQILTVP